ncbi:hypothetical protein HanRHA438_Chr16g0777261 [Helianthus annuus]|nr:hypothetical protein HanRHA438_Chr16g0777261 [Helianthus annuus]
MAKLLSNCVAGVWSWYKVDRSPLCGCLRVDLMRVCCALIYCMCISNHYSVIFIIKYMFFAQTELRKSDAICRFHVGFARFCFIIEICALYALNLYYSIAKDFAFISIFLFGVYVLSIC